MHSCEASHMCLKVTCQTGCRCVAHAGTAHMSCLHTLAGARPAVILSPVLQCTGSSCRGCTGCWILLQALLVLSAPSDLVTDHTPCRTCPWPPRDRLPIRPDLSRRLRSPLCTAPLQPVHEKSNQSRCNTASHHSPCCACVCVCVKAVVRTSKASTLLCLPCSWRGR